MNFQQHSKWKSLVALTGLALSMQFLHAAQNPGKTPSGPAPAVVNAAPPKSVFKQPNGPLEGKDPFYPRSTHPYTQGQPVTPAATTTPTPAPVIDVDLKLGGISGTREHPLAIINGHTFEAGEEADINSVSGRVHVRCIEIRPEGVSVLVNGRRKELRMRLGL